MYEIIIYFTDVQGDYNFLIYSLTKFLKGKKMKKFNFITVLFIWAFVIMFVAINPAICQMHGTEITIQDGIQNSMFSQPMGIAREDNETESGAIALQKYDLEAIYWNPDYTNLSIIGGFNYLNGIDNISIGDLFIGNDIVFDFDRNGEGNLLPCGTFDIIKDYTDWLDPTDILESSPFQYSGGGTSIGLGLYSIEGFFGSSCDPDVFVENWWGDEEHWDLRLMGDSTFNDLVTTNGTIHLTMSSGADTIHGTLGGSSPVPIPGTASLLIVPIFIFFANRRKILEMSS